MFWIVHCATAIGPSEENILISSHLTKLPCRHLPECQSAKDPVYWCDFIFGCDILERIWICAILWMKTIQ